MKKDNPLDDIDDDDFFNKDAHLSVKPERVVVEKEYIYVVNKETAPSIPEMPLPSSKEVYEDKFNLINMSVAE